MSCSRVPIKDRDIAVALRLGTFTSPVPTVPGGAAAIRRSFAPGQLRTLQHVRRQAGTLRPLEQGTGLIAPIAGAVTLICCLVTPVRSAVALIGREVPRRPGHVALPTDPVPGVADVITFVRSAIPLIADDVSLMAAVVAGGRYLIALVPDPIARGRGLVPLVPHPVPRSRGPVPHVTDAVPSLGHLVPFIGQMFVAPVHRPLSGGSAFFGRLNTFLTRAIAPVPGQTATLVCPVSFVVGDTSLQTGQGAIILSDVPHPDGLVALPIRLVAFLAGKTPIAQDRALALLRARLVGTVLTRGQPSCSTSIRLLGHAITHPTCQYHRPSLRQLAIRPRTGHFAHCLRSHVVHCVQLRRSNPRCHDP